MNSIFTEENLLAFTTAARFGSFSKAAEELGLTTSAISYTIKRMETGLDVVLFTRSTSSVWRRGWLWCCSLAVPAALS